MRKICVVTGTRAEYGSFRPLLQLLKDDPDFELQIVVTGMHLSPEFGLTYKQIEKDNFKINEKVETLLSSDTVVGISKSTGLGVIGFADTFERLKPDLVIVYGDRFEMFSAAVSAFLAKIPLAHLYGGEKTEGLMDEGIRHSLTKMSYLHFVSTEEYKKRVIQLGETPDRVFNVGYLALDVIRSVKLLSRNELEKDLGIRLGRKSVIVTFHPVTLEKNTSEMQFKQLLEVLNEYTDLTIIFTKPNADTHGRVIIDLIDEYTKAHPHKSSAFVSLGQKRYFSFIQLVDAVVGNTSSGLLEAPSFGKPTVDIGDRQRGRIKAESVIHCEPDKKSIKKALEKAFSKGFKDFCQTVKNPFGDGHSANRIYKLIKENMNSLNNIKKVFYDLQGD